MMKLTIKQIAAIMFSLFLLQTAQAQEIYNSSGKSGKANYRDNTKKKGFDASRIIAGGGLGAGFGNSIFSFQLSPVVGYRISNRFSAGVGLSYQYVSYRNYRKLIDYQTGIIESRSPKLSVISPNVWARFFVFDRFFTSMIGEYNFSNQTDYAWAQTGPMTVEKVKFNYSMPCLLLGVGYAQPVTRNSSFVVMAHYDVLQKATEKTVYDSRNNQFNVVSPYYGTVDFRVGFNLGF